MKKYTAFLLCLALLSLSVIPAGAADGPSLCFEADKSSVQVGDEVVFTVKIANNTFIDTLVLTVSAPSALTFVKAEKTEAVATFAVGANLLFEGVTGNGAIARLTYKVNDTAVPGASLALGCTVKECYDSVLNDIVVTKKNTAASDVTVLGRPVPTLSLVSRTPTVSVGSTAVFDLVLENNPGIDTLILSVASRGNAERVNAVKGSIVATMNLGAKYVFEGITDDGVLLTLYYRVPADATEGTELSPVFSVEECYDYALNDVAVTKNYTAASAVTILDRPADTLSLVPCTTTVPAGGIAEFDLILTGNAFINTMVLQFTAPSALTFVKAEKTEAVTGLTVGYNLVFEGVTGNGTIARLTYLVSGSVEEGEELGLGCTVKECYDAALNDITLQSISSSPIRTGHADVVFTVGTAVKKPGEIVSIPVSVTGTVPVDGLLIYEWQYDARIMEFVGYTDFGPLVTDSAAGQASVNSRTGVVNLGYADPILVDGIICSAQFRILDNAPDGTYALTCTGLSAADRGPVGSSVTEGAVTVQRWLPGDFNEDGTVDMQDAVHLIGWINFSWVPDLYPMPYNGSKDFNGDGTVSMQDAVYFIGWVNFSYLPDLYVINW